MFQRVGGVLLGLLIGGCTSVPRLDLDGVAISDIVQRIKCEIADAVPEQRGRFPAGDFRWMEYWTAKVELQLEITETSTLTPNITIFDPLKTVVIPAVDTFKQNFTVGASGKLQSQGYRNDNVSFTIAMNELRDIRRQHECIEPQGRGLLGKLGLQEWIGSALGPVANRDLTIGYHEAPTGSKQGGKIPGPVAPKAVVKLSPRRLLDLAQKQVQDSEKAAEQALDAADKAKESAIAKSTRTLSRLQATYDLVDLAYGWVEETNGLADKAENLAWQAERLNRDELKSIEAGLSDPIAEATEKSQEALQNKIESIDARKPPEDRAAEEARLRKEAADELDKQTKKLRSDAIRKRGSLAEGDIKTELERIRKDYKAATDRAARAQKVATSAWEVLPRDQPLDSIAHQIIFMVTADGNVSPNWTLVRFRGPTVSGTLFDAQRVRRHTLNIVMGQPQVSGGKELSDEQRRQLLNQKLDSLRLFVVPIQGG